MNISTFYGLNVGMTALDAAQQVENVISNNIANANTPGYAQETANLSEYNSFPTSPAQDALAIHGQLGQGVQVASVQRDTNAFLSQQDRSNQGVAQTYGTHSQNLSMIEGILNEPSSKSMQNAIDQFFNSWQTLSTNPSNYSARQSVISQAQTIGQTFQTISTELENLQNNLVGVTTNGVGQLNTDAKQVASLNAEIVNVQQTGQSPNTLLDKRATVLDDMSKLANISYTEQGNGAVYINLAASTLVDSTGSYLYPPTAGLTFNSQTNAPIITALSTLQTDLSGITSGSIAGNLASLNDTSSTLKTLDQFLGQFAAGINTQQQAGYELSGTATPPPMFTVLTDASGHTNLTVNSAMIPSNVAASDAPNQPGNNNNAVAVVGLQNQAVYNGGTYDQGLAGLVSGIGVEAASVIASDSTAKALAQQSSNMRQSVSGVDINEQAAQMVQFQNSYTAAAKFVSIFEQMMQSLLNIVP